MSTSLSPRLRSLRSRDRSLITIELFVLSDVLKAHRRSRFRSLDLDRFLRPSRSRERDLRELEKRLKLIPELELTVFLRLSFLSWSDRAT